jgi:hypothetical protein
MSDGRNFSSWQPGSVLSEELRKNAGIKTNWEYRKYMTDNADQIIKMNQMSACDQCCPVSTINTNNTNNTNTNISSNSPFIFNSSSDKSQPFGYEDSDMKNVYLSNFQLQSRMITPVIPQSEILEKGIPRRF